MILLSILAVESSFLLETGTKFHHHWVTLGHSAGAGKESADTPL